MKPCPSHRFAAGMCAVCPTTELQRWRKIENTNKKTLNITQSHFVSHLLISHVSLWVCSCQYLLLYWLVVGYGFMATLFFFFSAKQYTDWTLSIVRVTSRMRISRHPTMKRWAWLLLNFLCLLFVRFVCSSCMFWVLWSHSRHQWDTMAKWPTGNTITPLG